jgi:hypothetical protein
VEKLRNTWRNLKEAGAVVKSRPTRLQFDGLESGNRCYVCYFMCIVHLKINYLVCRENYKIVAGNSINTCRNESDHFRYTIPELCKKFLESTTVFHCSHIMFDCLYYFLLNAAYCF